MNSFWPVCMHLLEFDFFLDWTALDTFYPVYFEFVIVIVILNVYILNFACCNTTFQAIIRIRKDGNSQGGRFFVLIHSRPWKNKYISRIEEYQGIYIKIH